MAVAKKQPANSTTEVVSFPEIKRETCKILIKGTTPLICHRWSEKVRKEMLDKQQKAPKQQKEKRDPTREYNESTYFISQTPEVCGFPATGIKKAMVDAMMSLGGKKTEARQSFHVLGDAETADGSLVRIIAPTRTMREDMVRVMMSSDLRFRPQFAEWAMEVHVMYDGRQITPSQLMSLLNQAGFSIGIGEWRPQRSGMNGMFEAVGIK